MGWQNLARHIALTRLAFGCLGRQGISKLACNFSLEFENIVFVCTQVNEGITSVLVWDKIDP